MTEPAAGSGAPGARPESGGTLVVQPLPGIGDALWHLPHLRAIARTAPDRRVTLLTKERSLAERLFAAEPAVHRVLWLHRNPGRHDGLYGFVRLAALLRGHRFARAWILHASARYAQAAAAAGIAERHGYGLGAQRWFLNRPPFLSPRLASAHPIEKANRFMAAKGLRLSEQDAKPRLESAHPIEKADRFMAAKGLPLSEQDAQLPISPAAAQRIADRFGQCPRPWIALGIGSSETYKQWGGHNFAALAADLSAPERRTLFLLGGPAERDLGHGIAEQVGGLGGAVQTAVDLPIDQTAALLSLCRLYVGNDTGVLNLAAAVGTQAIGLFGGSPPLTYSPNIHVVLPTSATAGMAGITAEQVAAEVAKLGLD
jgi:heptosyltransferase-2